MSLITQCPACQTLFKVVADQLQVSQGWVRCGQCQNIFDANAHLYAQAPAAAEPAPSPVTEPLPEPYSETADPAGLASSEPHFHEATVSTGIVPDVDLSSQLPAHDPDAAIEPVFAQTPALEPEPVQSDALNIDITDKPPSFLRATSPRARRVSTWERAGLVLVILLLLGGLLVQFAAQERDWIAAHEPRLKPWLENFCDAMKCRVRTLRKIDDVVIESSSFTKVRPDLFALNFTLKNTGSVPLALPAMELSLIDAHDQALVRKVVREKDLGIHANTLAPSAQSSGSVLVNFTSADMAERIAGYRILAFYP